MDPETVKTFTKWAHEYLDELASKDKFFAKVWNSQKAFGEKWYPYQWHLLSIFRIKFDNENSSVKGRLLSLRK